MLHVHRLGLGLQVKQPAAEINLLLSDAVQIHRNPDTPASKIKVVLQCFQFFCCFPQLPVNIVTRFASREPLWEAAPIVRGGKHAGLLIGGGGGKEEEDRAGNESQHSEMANYRDELRGRPVMLSNSQAGPRTNFSQPRALLLAHLCRSVNPPFSPD